MASRPRKTRSVPQSPLGASASEPRRPHTGVLALLEGPGRPGGVQRSGKVSGAGSAVPRGFRSAVGDGGAGVKRAAVRCRKLPGATELPGP